MNLRPVTRAWLAGAGGPWWTRRELPQRSTAGPQAVLEPGPDSESGGSGAGSRSRGAGAPLWRYEPAAHSIRVGFPRAAPGGGMRAAGSRRGAVCPALPADSCARAGARWVGRRSGGAASRSPGPRAKAGQGGNWTRIRVGTGLT